MTERLENRLEDAIRARIAETGPIGVEDYMAICLGDQRSGYYATRDPFGGSGDFTTAPEISGLFGEMCGLYLAHMFEIAGQPGDASILELGPGRGTLMRDMRHVWAMLMPDLADASVHFVETSPTLRDVQLQTVGDEVDLTWHKDVDEALRSGKGPIFGVANEFFDALPVAQKVMEGGKWHERQVGIREDRLGYVIGPALSETDPALPETPPDGAVAELCPQACAIAMKLGDALVRRGGAILIVDYGRDGNPGDSLQAVNDHRAVDPFEAPGDADLSHWVDFAALASAVRSAGARLVGPVPQGRFLMQIGLGARAEQAGLNAEPEVRRDLLSAVDRLTSPAQMGEVFKVALLLPPGEGEPPGFMQEEV